MSDKNNPLKEVGGVITNVLLYTILQVAVTAPSINRVLDPATTANILAETINRNLCSLE
jgi:hypothetical protein